MKKSKSGKIRKFFRATSAEDINAIETDLNNCRITVYDITERNGYKCKEVLPDTENPVCEQICMKLGKKLGMGFLSSQLLSLQVKDVKTKSSKWLSAKDPVQTELGKEVFLRFRHIPTKLGCTKLKELDKKGLEYLYFQISDDFLHENLDLKNTIKKPDGLGLVTLSLLIKLRLDTEQNSNSSEDLNAFLRTTEVSAFVPKSFTSENIIDKHTLKKSIEKHLRNLHEKYPASKNSSKDLMKSFIEHILAKNELKQYFCEELFKGEMVVSSSAKVDIGVEVDKGTSVPCVKLLDQSQGTEYFYCAIEDLTSLEITKMDLNSHGVCQRNPEFQVQIGYTGGSPQTIYFSSESEAKSFVSCLEGFSRLTVDYYSSLCESVAPSWFHEMSQARVHGPSTIEYLKRVLTVKYSCRPDRYIVYKSLSEYDEYSVIYFKTDKIARTESIGRVEHTESGYKLVGDDRDPPVRDLKTLLRKTVINKHLVAPNSIPCRPQVEVCDTVYQLLMDQPIPRLAAEDEIEQEDQRRLEQQPKVYLPRDVQILDREGSIGRGYFTEVHKAILLEEDSVIVKSLRLSEIPDQYKHLCFQSLQDALVKQMSFNDPSLFIRAVGICLDSPTRILFCDTNEGNLKDFLRFRDSTNVLHLQHLNNATLNIANALWYMEQKNLYHGNLNCSNILVHMYDSQTLTVKIADPGMVTLYNKMPLDSEVNKRRIPWLSPKLFQDLSAVNIHTDMYAFGTTIWELFNSGWGPLEVGPLEERQPLVNWRHEKVLEFFQTKSILPPPVYLEDCKSDPQEIKAMKSRMYEIIKQCWEQDESEMILPERIVKEINQGIGNYGKYHVYDVIYYHDELVSATQPLSTTSETSGHASLIYQRQPKHVPDLSCLCAPEGAQRQTATIEQRIQVPQKTAAESHDQTQVAAEPLQGSSSIRQQSQIPLPKQNDQKVVRPKTEQRGPGVGQVRSPVQSPVQTGFNFSNGTQQVQQRSSADSRKLPLVKNVRHIISPDRLKVYTGCVLGQGHYGAVYKGELTPLSSTGISEPITVAVKRLKKEMLDKYADDFKKEINVMENLEHENIVKFYGICHGAQEIVMEYLEGGSLFHYVANVCKDKIIPQEKLIKISLDIAKGMEYLWSKKVLHMDLACRNVLLTRNHQAKVSDFGLSKVLIENDKDYYRRVTEGKVIPVFWCAVEWLGQVRFSTKCDVWSFGVTMWEMCSHGKKPNICKTEIEFQREGFHRLKRGERLPQPEHCRPELYQLMRDCWLDNPDARPDFSQCVIRLQQMISPSTNQLSAKATGSAACALPSGSLPGKGDNPKHLSKTESQNSEDDDYQKMTAKGVEVTAGDTENSNNAEDDKSVRSDKITPRGDEKTANADEITAGGNANADEITAGGDKMTQRGDKMTANANEITAIGDKMAVKGDRMTANGDLNTAVRIEMTVKGDDNVSGEALNFTDTGSPGQNCHCDNGKVIDQGKKYFISKSDIVLTEECLGQGSFGRVIKGKLKENGKEVDVAVKIFESAENTYKRFQREMQYHCTLDHPNIVKFKGMLKDDSRTEKYVMELMHLGSLISYIVEHGVNTRLHVKLRFLLDIAQGMSYLAEKTILHCDLTAANILVAADLTAKISDFGLSKRLPKEKTETGIGFYKRNGAKFKLLWSAPEVCQQEVYTHTSDVWSYGVLCLEVFLDGRPVEFHGKDSYYWNSKCLQYFELINQGERFLRPEGCPEELYELLKQCWSKPPEKRPTFDKIIEKVKPLQETAQIEDLKKGRWRPI